jgi:hypothetical protein
VRQSLGHRCCPSLVTAGRRRGSPTADETGTTGHAAAKGAALALRVRASNSLAAALIAIGTATALTPVGFLAGMLMLLWFIAAGVTLALRPPR